MNVGGSNHTNHTFGVLDQQWQADGGGNESGRGDLFPE